MLFKELTDEEEAAFRLYARTTDPPNMDRWDLYHPVCREEWEKRGISPERLTYPTGGERE